MLSAFWYLRSIIVTGDHLFGRTMRIMLKSVGFDSVDIVSDLPHLRKRQTYSRHDLIVADSELTLARWLGPALGGAGRSASGAGPIRRSDGGYVVSLLRKMHAARRRCGDPQTRHAGRSRQCVGAVACQQEGLARQGRSPSEKPSAACITRRERGGVSHRALAALNVGARPALEQRLARNPQSETAYALLASCRRKATNVAASVDAYAARIVASMQAFPDPRTFLNADDEFIDIAITGPVDGPLAVGSELFDIGEVTAGGKCIARAGNVTAAHIVRAVLLIDPDVSIVKLPKGQRLQRMQREWQAAINRWRGEFAKVIEQVLAGVSDPRTRQAVGTKALALMHVS